MAVLAYQFDQALFPELAIFVLRFSHAIAISQEDLARLEVDRTFFIGELVKQANHHAAAIQTPQCSVFADDDRWQMSAVAVGQFAGRAIVERQE